MTENHSNIKYHCILTPNALKNPLNFFFQIMIETDYPAYVKLNRLFWINTKVAIFVLVSSWCKYFRVTKGVVMFHVF